MLTQSKFMLLLLTTARAYNVLRRPMHVSFLPRDFPPQSDESVCPSRREAIQRTFAFVATMSTAGAIYGLEPAVADEFVKPPERRSSDIPAFNEEAVKAAEIADAAEAAADMALLDQAEEEMAAATASGNSLSRRAGGMDSNSNTISYDEFLTLLFRDEAEKVQFYGSQGEIVVVTTKDEGLRLTVTDVPGGDGRGATIGPLKVVAKVRDSKVPYSFESLDLKSFRSRNIELNPFSTIQPATDTQNLRTSGTSDMPSKLSSAGLIEKIELPNMNAFKLKIPDF